jgi:anion-transporting  ArsA/GET3 family ATPase
VAATRAGASVSGADHLPGDLLTRRLLFVTGKGGVGKTTVAAALAQLAAQRGARVLVCEMDAKGSLSSAYDQPAFEYEPRRVPGSDDLWGMAMNTEDSLREYLKLFVRVPFVGRIGPLARTFDFVADAAPGVKEILAVGKLCYEVRERHYDLVVVDAEASGHIVSQIDAPRAITELVKVGLIRDQTRWMLDLLDDPVVTGLVVVTTPEEMPVNETIELVDRVRNETHVDVAGVIVNRVLPAVFDTRQREVFELLTEPGPQALLTDAAGPKVTTVLEAARLRVDRADVAAEHLADLAERLPTGLPVLHVPELFTRATGRRAVQQVAEHLGAELEGSG